MKHKNQAKPLRKLGRILLCALTVLFLLIGICAVGAGVWARKHFETELPIDFFRLTAKGESPRFYAYDFSDRVNRQGTPQELESGFFAQKRTSYLSYPEIPQHIIDAFVAIEDKRFYEHSGVDWYRTLAAGVNYVLGFSNRFGASTITQQVVKNITGNDQISLQRKIQEIFLAHALEREMDKSEIMELYLNVIHFSDHCNGLADAARHYYSKSVSELTVSEAATIAAITNSPAYYNPIRHPEHNLARRNLILSEMYAQGYLTKEDYDEAIAEGLNLVPSKGTERDGINTWYADMVLEDVIGDLMREYGISRATASSLVYAGGVRIDVAMDAEIQAVVEEYYQTAVQTPINAKGEHAQSALIVIDSRTGDVLAVAGAVGEKNGNRLQNFATQTLRPPGSAIKPISVYAPALEEGLINWGSVFDDVPVNFGTDATMWPKNATGVYRGLTDISYAVAHSTNTVAVRVLERLGLENSFSWAHNKFHLENLRADATANDCDYAALALGQLNYGVTLRELTDAYTVFADGGSYHPWRSYYRVLDAEGKILLSNPDRSEIVLSEENAAIMTKLLQGVVKEGTSSSITLDRITECAGKTGTTNADADRWYIGYTPDLICGVWCGYAYPEPLAGRNPCPDIWNRVMHRVVKECGGRTTFEIPNGVVRASYCVDSGELPSEACAADARGNRTKIGWFSVRDLPRTPCTCHVLCDYDAENGVNCGYCPKESLHQVALIRVNRQFPRQVTVTDAQYVYGGDPTLYTPEENTELPYFGSVENGYHGISNAAKPFNRACTEHRIPPNAWDYLLPQFFSPPPSSDE